ncbi:hypothetical protein NN6n1_13040 [Shinella zoogloeoides]
MTFCEAYALYGRDSMAIAEACGIGEPEAYNLMAARANRDLGIMPDRERKAQKREANRRWHEKKKAANAELRREAAI